MSAISLCGAHSRMILPSMPRSLALVRSQPSPRRPVLHLVLRRGSERRRTTGRRAASDSEEPSSEDTSTDVSETEEEGPLPPPPLTGLAAVVAQAKEKGDDLDVQDFLAQVELMAADLSQAKEDAELLAQAKDDQYKGMKDQFVRLQADFENFRKRSAAEKDASRRSATTDVVQDFIPLIDNFELARQQIKVENDGEAKINESYQGLYRQMVDIFKELGVEAVPTVGFQFDPETQEAVLSEETAGVTDGEVVKEFRKGFTMNGNLIRAAMVVVCNNPDMPYVAPPEEQQPPAEGEDEETAEASADGEDPAVNV
jgi:molecular chaperone GrpE